MWISTLELSIQRVLPTQILGRFWRGAYFSSLAPLQVRNEPRPQLISSNWVRVRNILSGICGSDLHLVFTDGDLRIAPAALPAHEHSYPGHEVVGEIIEVGENTQELQVGDRVVLRSSPNCLSEGINPPCSLCLRGDYNLCENINLPTPHPIGGGWSEEMLLPEQQLFRIPAEMNDEQAVLLEPTAVALHTVLRHLPQAGDKVLIIGAGTIGLLTLQVVRSLSPKAEISVMARHTFQVEQATRMGATTIVYGRDSYETIRRTTGAKLYTGALNNKMLLGGYDVIYDTVGNKSTVNNSLRWTRAGGTIVISGVNLHLMTIDLSPVWFQEVNLLGTMAHGMETWPLGSSQQRSTFEIATDMIIKGIIQPEKLITHRFALNNFREALQTAMNKKGSRAIKVVFDAALLRASAVPNMHTSNRVRPTVPTQIEHPHLPNTPLPVSSGPSQFTMAQSEDFTADFEDDRLVLPKSQHTENVLADFEDTQFVAPKPRRPPSALQFRRTPEDRPLVYQPLSPSDATNMPFDTLQNRERIDGDSTSAPQN